MKSRSCSPPAPATDVSTRLRYSGDSSLEPLSRPRVRGWGVYLLTPGMSRARAEDAAAVMGFTWEWCEWDAVDGAWAEEDARRKGSKFSLRRSNSSDSGAESSYFCSCARGGEEDVHERARDRRVGGRTCEPCGLFERNVHLGRVPPAVVAVEKEGRLADGVETQVG